MKDLKQIGLVQLRDLKAKLAQREPDFVIYMHMTLKIASILLLTALPIRAWATDSTAYADPIKSRDSIAVAYFGELNDYERQWESQHGKVERASELGRALMPTYYQSPLWSRDDA